MLLLRALAVSALAMVSLGALAAEQGVAAYGPFEAFVAENTPCATRMKLRVEASDPASFEGDAVDLGKLVAGARAVLGFSCGNITDILIDGTSNGQTVFAGITTLGTGWSVIKVPHETVQSGAAVGVVEADPGYSFSGLIAAIESGSFEAIPDDQETRAQVGSILRAFTERCADAPADIAMKAARYISPQLREMERNPSRGIAQMLMDFANMRDRALDTGDFTGAITDFAQDRAAFRTEGIRDGRIYIRLHGCLSPEVDQFTRQLYSLISSRSGRDPSRYDEVEYSRMMSPQFREQMNIADPEAALRARRVADLTNTGTKACSAAFAQAGFCTCVIDNLTSANIDDATWEAIGKDFRAISRFPELRPHVAACY